MPPIDPQATAWNFASKTTVTGIPAREGSAAARAKLRAGCEMEE